MEKKEAVPLIIPLDEYLVVAAISNYRFLIK